ncbi:MAG: acetyl-CoA decarbonylase/synthase complex subunit delta [Proteobacteria bacterium]|nr:acetyl-CoA decarbonylase/synthase complex subunit delta [Pseudomonadota bacterium]
MPIEIPRQNYAGKVKPLTLGAGQKAVTVGGEEIYPFYTFEGTMPFAPRIAIQVLDYKPDEWPEALKEPYADVLHDPVAWAKKAQDVYKADMIHLWLKSTDPNGLNRSAQEAALTAKAVADAIALPLIVWGTANADKDVEVLKAVAEACRGKDIIIGPVDEANHKQLGAQALADNLTLIANSPIDINLAKQLNILLSNLGVPIEKIIIDPTTGGLGYGIEYTYSVMERIRKAAITQNDEKLQCPFFCNLAEEVWKTKEAKQESGVMMGDARKRGVLMEAITAATLLNAGADILVMRHPDAILQVRRYIADLGGFAAPKSAKIPVAEKREVSVPAAPAASVQSGGATFLKAGSLCRIVQIMDMPVGLAPGYAIALIKSIDHNEEGEGIVFSTHAGADITRELGKRAEESLVSAPAGRSDTKPEFEPAASWIPLQDAAGEGQPAVPTEKHDWRARISDRDEMLKQAKTDQRYWYSESHGSEKRKKPA